MMLIYLAFGAAEESHQNSGTVAAIANGGVLFALFGSFFIYHEQITIR